MNPLQSRMRSDAENVGNPEMVVEVSRGAWIPQLQSILTLQLKFKQHWVYWGFSPVMLRGGICLHLSWELLMGLTV